MKLLTREVIVQPNIYGEYLNPVTFHAFWNGALNEKHFISIKSCYHFNIKKYSNRKIILWVENNTETKWNSEIEKYAEIRVFDLDSEVKNSPLVDKNYYYKRELSFYSDLVRYTLLYKYGGCWFDLDVFFLKDFSPIFSTYSSECIVYQWERQNYPNGAIYISLSPQHETLKGMIEFIIKRNKGWGFQEANLTYDIPVDLLVLPCSWFDPSWVADNLKSCDSFFKESNDIVTFDTFFADSFCFHWHNRWSSNIHIKSPCSQLFKFIEDDENKTTETR